MVVPHEPLLVVLVQVKHPLPDRAAPPGGVGRVRAKINVRHPALDEHELQILLHGVSLVSRHRLNREVLRHGFDQRLEIRAVARMRVADLDGRNHVGLHSAHQVSLHPIFTAHCVRLPLAIFRFDLALLGIAPALIDPRRETGAVNCEVPINFRQGPGRFDDELLEVRRQHLVAEIVEDTVVARQFRQVALLVRLPQIGGAVNLTLDCI